MVHVDDLFTEVRRSLFSRFRWSTEASIFRGETFFKVILCVGNNQYDFAIEPYEDSSTWRRNFNSGVRDLKSKAIKVAWRDAL
jgi:hypothetical protein